MSQILTYEQAQAVGAALGAAMAAGGWVTRITFMEEGGRIKVKVLADGSIVVLRINGLSRVEKKRAYDGLADFVAQHRQGEST